MIKTGRLHARFQERPALRRKRMGRSWKSQKVFVTLGDRVSETRHGAFLAGFDRLKSFQERPALRRKRMGRSWKKVSTSCLIFFGAGHMLRPSEGPVCQESTVELRPFKSPKRP